LRFEENRLANERAREFQKLKALADARKNARTVPRNFDNLVSIPGIGIRRAQVIMTPSFSPGAAWEIRERRETLRLYRSEVVLHLGREWKLLGYDEVELSSSELRLYLDRLWKIEIPAGPSLNGMSGVDGVSYELALFGDLQSEIRLRWWMEGPEEWQPVIGVVMGMIEKLRAAKVRQ
jgi:hypothetical protein